MRLSSIALIFGLVASVILPVLAVSASVSVVATDSDAGDISLGSQGGQKLISDSLGKHLAVYVDSNGRLAVSVANGDPRLAGSWSPAFKSPAPSSDYRRPAAVLVSQTTLRVIAEGGTGSQNLVDVLVTLTRDSGGNILGLSYGVISTLDNSGAAFYPSAVLAHDGSIILVWNVHTGSVSKVNALRRLPASGWRSITDTSSTAPTVLISDSSNTSPIFPSVIERMDNHKLYVLGNRGSGSSNIAFNSATFNGQNWTVGSQNLAY